MNQNKYYVPNTEDIKIGYQCQAYFNNEWVDYIFPNTMTYINTINDQIKQGLYKTPYLTKEDIESLGWVMSDTVSDYCFGVKGNYELTYSFVNKLLRIRDMSDSKHPYPILHNCFCPSVNELIYICKLLKIK